MRLVCFAEGYRSETVHLAEISGKSDENLRKIGLQPIAGNLTGLVSAGDERASGGQRKLYEKALDKAAKQDWRSAIASLEEVVAAYPEYSSAWLTLGILQQIQGDRTGAEKSYLASAHADAKFALPLIRAAAAEAMQGNMAAALAHSQAVNIDPNPAAFPDAYVLNAIANIAGQNLDVAEKSAREGLRLEANHQYPELEYALGVVLYSKDDHKGATEHLQKYVEAPQADPMRLRQRINWRPCEKRTSCGEAHHCRSRRAERGANEGATCR